MDHVFQSVDKVNQLESLYKMFKTCLVLYVFSFFTSHVFCETENPIIDTTNGKIEGKILTTLFEKREYYGFMGIPYAVPPLKELRFTVKFVYLQAIFFVNIFTSFILTIH